VDVLRASDVLQKLILSRVENLPEAPRQVIRAAAVIGPGFRISVLQAALGSAVDPVSLSTHLRSLVDASLLQSLEGGVDSRYAFQQGLVRTVLYNSLSFDRRHELHGRIADSLASSKPSRRQLGSRIAAFLDASDIRKEERQAALIAYHQEGAERFLQAAQTYLSAAQLARQRKDWIDADQYYQKALNVLKQCKPRPESQSALNLTMFNALVGSADIQMIRDGSPKEAFAVLETAQNIPDSDLSPEAATALGLRLAVLLPALGKPSDGLAMAKHTYANAPATLRPLASAVYAWLAYRHTGQIDSGLLETAQDAAASLPGLQPLLAELRADWQAASAGYLALDLPQAAALMHIYQGDVFLAAGDGQAADQHYLQAARLWRNNERDAAGLALAAFRHAAAAKLCGNNAAARRALNHTVRRLQDAPAPIRREGRIIVRQANKLVDAEIGQPWPSWRWDFLVDHLKLTLFYPQLQFLGL
jgi:hypothetical protein